MTSTVLAVMLLIVAPVSGDRAQQATAPVTALRAGADISGAWRFKVFGNWWKVDLKETKSPGKFGDVVSYCGPALRDDKDDQGKAVTETLCAIRNTKENKLQVMVGTFMACEAPFADRGTMKGDCTFARSRKGEFAASRGTPTPR